MNILITGGAGFIGSHIVEELIKIKKNNIINFDLNNYDNKDLNENKNENNSDYLDKKDSKTYNNKINLKNIKIDSIIIVDNLSSGKLENLDKFINDIIFIKEDIVNYDKIFKIIKNYKIDYIFHQAALVSVFESVENPLRNNEINIKGSLNILEAARLNKVKKVISASSAAVYGQDVLLPIKEEDSKNPVSPYGLAKYVLEHYSRLYYNLYSLNTVCLRYFNVYGERQDPSSQYSGVISIFTDAFKKDNVNITIFGDGKQTRDFVYVKDIVKANFLVAFNDNINFDIFNVGTSKETNLLEIVSIMEKITGKKASINFEPERKGDIKRSVANIDKIKRYGFIPDYEFEMGIRRLLGKK